MLCSYTQEEVNEMTMKTEKSEYALRPASHEDAGYFYALLPEQDEELGAIGHLRIDFGGNGREWWSSWQPRGPECLNTPEFGVELDDLVNELRQDGGLLHDLASMERYCCSHGGAIEGGWRQNYGYEAETEKYLYRIRCSPGQGDYHCYLSCFDKHQQELMRGQPLVGRASFINGEVVEFKNYENFLNMIREELPYQATSGFRFEVLTDDPHIRKAVDDVICDLYGEDAPKQIEDYGRPEQNAPTMTM